MNLDPRISQMLIQAVDTRFDQLARRQPRTAYGVVQAVDTTYRRATVLLSGDTVGSTDFKYGREAEPTVNDLARVVIDPSGDRYIESVIEAKTLMPYVYSAGTSDATTQGATTNLAIVSGANAGCAIIPFTLPGPMLLQSFVFSNGDTTLLRTASWRLYDDTNNNGSLVEVAGANGTFSFTAAAVGPKLSIAAGAPVFLVPGTYYVLLRNTSTANTFSVHLGVPFVLTPLQARKKDATPVLAATMTTTGFAGFSNRQFIGMLIGRVFGEANGWDF